MTSTTRPCVFLDRDGTLHEDVDYLRDPAQLQLFAGAADALVRLREAGFALIVVTNQSGIARGYLSEDDLGRIHAELERQLAAGGSHLDGIYFSPFHPSVGDPPYRRSSDCRKPEPGMLLRAAREHSLDLGASWIIGDTERDLEAGTRVGCRAVLVATGKGASEHERIREKRADYRFVPDLGAAAELILGAQGK